MIKLLVIADDFTGALDAGVKFFSSGASTKVITDLEVDFNSVAEDVLVLCAPTRHLPYSEAYSLIRQITERAISSGVSRIFKKTDSALRGNIGAEISAVLDGSGEKCICFIPALPAMNRITVNGIHYVDGVPVSQSVFGQDPFNPVMESHLPTLLHHQCDVPVKIVSSGEEIPEGDEPCIYIMDCASYEDMKQNVQMLNRCNRLKVLAGCAGFAEILPAYMQLEGGKAEEYFCIEDRLTVVCGSVSPISCSQMDYAEKMGFNRVHIPMEMLLAEEGLQTGNGKQLMDQLWNCYSQADGLIVDSLQKGTARILKGTSELSLEDLRKKIACKMGHILKNLLDRGAMSRIMIIGGDTLLAFLEAICCRELRIVCELEPGVVLSRISYRGRDYEVVSKSGGFGGDDLLVKLMSKQKTHMRA